MASREERSAMNEATAREINQTIEQNIEELTPGGLMPIVCECSYASCEEAVVISPEEYTALRAEPRRFAIVRDHLIESIEWVVFETDRFMVVSKREGAAADIVEDRARNE